jgi:RNA polymerase sigma factor (sigma-70 family)
MERAAVATEPDRPEPARGVKGIPPFQAFLDEHRDVVYRFLLASVGPNEVDDCFQETFLAALRGYPRLRHGDNLRGWVLAIATRKAIDAARSRKRRPEPVADVDEVAESAWLAGHVGPWAQVEELAVLGPVGPDGVWEDVMALPPRQRVALVHRVLLDRPYAELAAAMGCSIEAARANVYQALRKLREVWAHGKG